MAVALPTNTTVGNVLFAKNSDRHCNEVQVIEYQRVRSHSVDATVRCTYLTIPQARTTNAVILCRPFWTWGAEMGANQHGVVVGNEGLHARSAGPETEALTGMDLVRLALERAATAHQAVDVITFLLERHGQGGNCGYAQPAYYNNGFIIADRSAAFVLETVNREWLVERVSGVRSMSNVYSIGRRIVARSAGLTSLIRNNGWSSEDEPDYAAAIADPHREHIGNAGARKERSNHLLAARAERLTVADFMQLLRDHGTSPSDSGDWKDNSVTRRTLCMHAGTESSGQTVGSMVSDLRQDVAVHWITGTAAPCISVFKPLLMDAAVPIENPKATGQFDVGSLWWRHERLHRAALLRDFSGFLGQIAAARDALEADFRSRIDDAIRSGNVSKMSAAVIECWLEAQNMEGSWHKLLGDHSLIRNDAYAASWNAFNRQAGFVI